MNTFIQNNINFTIKDKSLYNESKHVIGGKVSSIKNDYENYNNDNNSYLINAIDIDWNDSELEYAKISNDINTLIDDNYTNVRVNTTGEFLDLLNSMSEKINYIKGKYNELYPLIMRRIVISKNENVLSATLLGEPFSVNWTSSNPNIKFADPSIPIYVGHDTYETYTGTSVRIEYRGEARKGGKFTIEPKSDIVYYPDSIICNIIWTGTEFNETTLITASKDTYISASLDCSLTIYGSPNMTSNLAISTEHVNTSGLNMSRLLSWPVGHNWSLNKNWYWRNVEIPYRFTEETDNDGELIDNIFKINLNSTEFTDNVYVTVVPLIHQYLTFTAVEDSTFKLISLNTSFEQQDYPYINYSLDNGESWNKLDLDTETPIIESGKKIMWSADFSTPENSGGGRWLEHSPGYVGNFISSAKFNVSGNIYSIIYGHQFKGHYDYARNNYRFYKLFKDSKVINASNLILPATKLAGGYYEHMFYGCTSLTTAPALPATSLAVECYAYMFSGCTNLTSAPALPASTLAENCYQYMFGNCTSLTTAPALPATTLADSCYNYMFRGCTSLTTPPVLPATTLAENCYSDMFYECTSLTSAPELPAITLAESCYANMFYRCSSLTSAPSILPATTLAKMCYYFMFTGCTSLTTAPALPATTLAKLCYYYMFKGCTSLTSAPALSATTLTYRCYYYMFNGCTSLTTAPELPASTLAEGCYYSMFYGCTSLTSAPALPATTLATECYKSMFSGCTSLTTAPVLPATILTADCYNNMFYNCSSLNYIKALFVTTPGSSYTTNWVYGVANSGTFVKSSKATWNNAFNASCIPLNNTYKWAVEYDEIIWKNQYLTLTALEDNTTFAFKNAYISCSTDNGSSWFEVAGPNTSQTIATINAGQTILFKGTETPTSSNGIGTFISNKPFNASGNAMSLLYGDNFRNQTSLLGKNYAFYNLFNNSKVVDASNLILPATTLVERCYHSMFYGCKSLTSAPELPAETLASHCCNCMFSYCTNLTTAPELTATTLADYCYYGMFEVCTSLITAPSMLPATTLATGCYKEMFYKCTNLTSAPTLPATTLVNKCYEEMFALCSSLNYIKAAFITVPDESYTGSWVYRVANSGTFVKNYKAKWPNKYDENNIPLNDTYPWGVITWDFENDVEHETYEYLALTALENDTTFTFNKNSNSNINLSYSIDGKNWTPITTSNPTTTSVSKDTTIMFKGTCTSGSINESNGGCGQFKSNNKTFNISGNIMSLVYGDDFKNQTLLNFLPFIFCRLFVSSKVVDASNLLLPATSLTEGVYHTMFASCASLITPPELPAKSLVKSCYVAMFGGCTSLTTAPSLSHITSLAEQCFNNMFSGCTSLTTAPELPVTTLSPSCYTGMFFGCTSLTTAPTLPATTLVSNCYSQMFYKCSSLNYIKAAFTTTPSEAYTNNWVYGVASSGIFDQIGNATWEIYGNNAIPTNWKLYRNGQSTFIEIHLQISVSQSTGTSSDWQNFLSNGNARLKEIYAQIGSTYVLLSSNPSPNSNFINGNLPGITVNKQFVDQTINRFNLVYTANNGQSRTYTCERNNSWPPEIWFGSSTYGLTI